MGNFFFGIQDCKTFQKRKELRNHRHPPFLPSSPSHPKQPERCRCRMQSMQPYHIAHTPPKKKVPEGDLESYVGCQRE